MKAKYRYPKRMSIAKAVEDAAVKAKYYAGFDTTGVAYFNNFVKQMARFISNNYRRRQK